VLFGSALIAGSAYRHLRSEAGKFATFIDTSTFPFTQYAAIFFTAFLFTAISQNCVWMLHALDPNKSFQQNMVDYYQQKWWTITAFSLVGALFSCVFVAWLQRASEQAYERIKDLLLKRLLQSLLFAIITAIMTMIIFIVTAGGGSTEVLSRYGVGSRLTEIVVAFLATFSGLVTAAWLFNSQARDKKASQ
jgi:hypothetical protein